MPWGPFIRLLYCFDQVTQAQGISPIVPLIPSKEGGISQYSPSTVQVATVSLQIAIARFWKSCGIQPSAVVGHSLGHYAALNCVGVLSETDTISLVAIRAQLLEKRCISGTHSMLAVKTSLATIEPLLYHSYNVEVACINGPEDVVVSELCENIENCAKLIHAHDIRAILLSTQYAFHSAQVDCILKDYISRARTIIYRTPSVPVICPLQGKVIDKCGVFGPEHLAAHCRGRVNIIGAMEAAQSQGILPRNSHILEVGDHQTFSNMLKSIFRKGRPNVSIISSLIKNTDTWKTVSGVLASLYRAAVNVEWREYHHEFESTLDVVPLPAYSWDLKPYWIQYVNDLSLRKGDPPTSRQYEDRKSTMPPLLNTTIYNIVREEVGQISGLLTVQVDLSKENINSLVQGHKVIGIPLCTPVC